MPAMGWPGTTKTLAGEASSRASEIAAFTEPTSETTAPGFRPLAASLATSPMAAGGAAKMTRSASATANAGSSNTWSA